jgi:YD repeat-containing protein
LNQTTAIETSTQGTNGFPVGSATPGTALSIFAQYNFSGTQNNGQIMSMVDARQGGSTVSYAYDSLKRLTSASTSGWTQAITYDGFSNIATKTVPTGSAEPTFPGANTANNRLTGAAYDANGNMTGMPRGGPALAYDYENRAKSATMGSFVESYAYDENNRRVEKSNSGNDFIYSMAWMDDCFRPSRQRFRGAFIRWLWFRIGSILEGCWLGRLG